MELKEYLKIDPPTSKHVLGRYIKTCREEMGIKAVDFATELSISRSYLCDIENGNRRIPTRLIPVLKRKFSIKDCDEQDFNDLVSLNRGYGFPDINKYLFCNYRAVEAIRVAQEVGLSGEEFLDAVNQVLEERELAR